MAAACVARHSDVYVPLGLPLPPHAPPPTSAAARARPRPLRPRRVPPQLRSLDSSQPFHSSAPLAVGVDSSSLPWRLRAGANRASVTDALEMLSGGVTSRPMCALRLSMPCSPLLPPPASSPSQQQQQRGAPVVLTWPEPDAASVRLSPGDVEPPSAWELINAAQKGATSVPHAPPSLAEAWTLRGVPGCSSPEEAREALRASLRARMAATGRPFPSTVSSLRGRVHLPLSFPRIFSPAAAQLAPPSPPFPPLASLSSPAAAAAASPLSAAAAPNPERVAVCATLAATASFAGPLRGGGAALKRAARGVGGGGGGSDALRRWGVEPGDAEEAGEALAGMASAYGEDEDGSGDEGAEWE